jgi:hypothetical protein
MTVVPGRALARTRNPGAPGARPQQRAPNNVVDRLRPAPQPSPTCGQGMHTSWLNACHAARRLCSLPACALAGEGRGGGAAWARAEMHGLMEGAARSGEAAADKVVDCAA